MELTADLQALLRVTGVATLILDRELRVVRFTSHTAERFHIRHADRRHALADVARGLGFEDLHDEARRALDGRPSQPREIRTEDGRWYITHILPSHNTEDGVDGVVITFVDVTERKRSEKELRDAKVFAESIVETLHEPLLVLNPDLTVTSVNPAFYEHFQVSKAGTIGRRIYDLGNGQWEIPELRKLLEDVLPDSKVFNDFEVRHRFEDIGERVMLLNARRLDHVQLILLGIRDITERKKNEEVLRRSEDRLRMVLDTQTVGVLFFDESGTLIECNGAFLQMTGYTRAEVESRALTWRAMTPAEWIPASEEQLRFLKETGRIGPYEKEYILKDGSRSWMLFAGRDLGDGTVVEYCIDVGDRRKAEQALRESEAKYRNLFESIDEGFCIVQVIFDEADRPVDYRFVELNPAFDRHTGLGDVRGRTIRELRPEHEEHWFETYGRIALTGEPVRFVSRAAQLGRWYDVYAWRYGGPENRQVAVLFSDITERKENEEALRQARDELEQRVAERTGELRGSEERLRALALELTQTEQRERRQLSLVLHDHLQQLILGAQMHFGLAAQEAEQEGLRELLNKGLEVIGEALKTCRTLAVELSPPVLHDQGLGAALGWLAGRMQEMHRLSVKVAAEEPADPESEELRVMLFHAARELLLNVVKHADADHAWVRLTRKDTQRICLEVADNGAGFDPQASDVEERSRQSFGLFHIRERLLSVGGDLEIESAPGRGTRVRLLVREEIAAPPHAAEVPAQSRSTLHLPRPHARTGSGIRILVVDDHGIVRAGLTSVLSRQPGFDVIGEAVDGEQAIELARDLEPDVVLMDMTLPGINGVAATRQITAAMPEVKVIGLSAHAAADMRQAMIDAGAVRYLTKGGPPEDLIGAIREAVAGEVAVRGR